MNMVTLSFHHVSNGFMERQNKTRNIAILFLLSCLGCTTTQQAMDRANNRYVGHNIDDLVLIFGIPCGQHQLNDGRRVYTWNLGQQSYYIPYQTNTTGSINSFGQYSSSSYTYGGGVATVSCDIEVITTNNGIITQIIALRDTWGNWTTSRCSEIFK
jgi:hypothetical protein